MTFQKYIVRGNTAFLNLYLFSLSMILKNPCYVVINKFPSTTTYTGNKEKPPSFQLSQSVYGQSGQKTSRLCIFLRNF